MKDCRKKSVSKVQTITRNVLWVAFRSCQGLTSGFQGNLRKCLFKDEASWV